MHTSEALQEVEADRRKPDRRTELRFTVSLYTKQVISGMLLPAYNQLLYSRPDEDSSDADVSSGCSRQPPVHAVGSQARVSAALS